MDARAELIVDTPASRLIARGWAALAEERTLTWARESNGVSREELIAMVSDSLPALVGTVAD